MFGVGLPEVIVISIIVLLVFGPERLPEITRKLGRLTGQLRKTSDSVRREFYNSMYTPAQDLSRDIQQGARNLLVTPTELEVAPIESDNAPDNSKQDCAPEKGSSTESTS